MSAELKDSGNPERRYFFRRLKMLGFAAIGIAVALLFLFLAYDISDPDWFPTAKRSRNRFFSEILVSLPPWGRAAIIASFALILLSISVQILFHACDRKPDFTIGPDGISRNMLFRFRRISWPELQMVRLQEKKILFGGQRASGSARKAILIEFDSKFFSGERDEVLDLVRYYRPDLNIEQPSILS